MGKASCTYVSSFILGLFAIVFIFLAIFTSIGLISLGEESSNNKDRSVITKILEIPNQDVYSAGCVLLLSAVLLVALGYVL